MYFKSALLAAVAATALASESSTSQNQISGHRQFKVENQICVSKQPITTCQHGFQPIYDQENQYSVEMYCLNEAHPLANQMQQVMETGRHLKTMQQESQKRTQRVPNVIRCYTPRLSKDGDEVEDDAQQQQQRNGLRYSKFNRPKFASSQYRNQYQNKQEQRKFYETIRTEQQEKLHQLKKLMPTIEKAVQLSDSQYEEAYQLIKKIAHQDEKIEGGLFMLSQYLPQAYVEATQRIQNELVEDDMPESEKQEVQEQLKKLAKRVYVYSLTRLVQEQQEQPISEQVEEDNYTNWEQFEEQFQRLWQQIKREMDTDKINQVERQVEREFKQEIKNEEQTQLNARQLTLQDNDDKRSNKQQYERNEQHNDKRSNKQQYERNENDYEHKQPKNLEENMTREQRERQQLQLTKIIMAGLKTAEEMQKQQKNGAFGGLFSSKVNYQHLAQQTKKQFKNTDF